MGVEEDEADELRKSPMNRCMALQRHFG